MWDGVADLRTRKEEKRGAKKEEQRKCYDAAKKTRDDNLGGACIC